MPPVTPRLTIISTKRRDWLSHMMPVRPMVTRTIPTNNWRSTYRVNSFMVANRLAFAPDKMWEKCS